MQVEISVLIVPCLLIIETTVVLLDRIKILEFLSGHRVLQSFLNGCCCWLAEGR